MKKLLKILLGIVLIILVAVAAVFYLTRGLVETADKFFAAVQSNNLDQAMTFLSEEFKASTSVPKLQAFLTSSALMDYKEGNWSSRSIENNQGKLTGSVLTKSGGVIPLQLSFVKENEAWKIYSIEKRTAGLKDLDVPRNIPEQAKQIALVKDSIARFGESINADDFSILHQDMSQLWQSQSSPDKLKEAFASFVEQSVDLTGVKDLDPIFDEEAALNENGFLVLKGHYPTSPSVLSFQLKYVFEHIDWKLVGLQVNLK